MADAHKNFALSTLTNSPGTGGTTFSVSDATQFPTTFPFNATVWPSASQPKSSTAEIVTVTSVSTNDFTVTRGAESSTVQNVVSGWQMAATITAKTLTDIENANYVNSYSPYLPASAWTGLQTIGASNLTSGTNSLYVFPITLPYPTKFNQIIIANSLSYLMNSTAGAGSNSYYSLYGLYSMINASSVMNLISASSYWIYESISYASITWSYPTTTVTTANGTALSTNAYGNFTAGSNLTGSGPMISYISGPRQVGLQFGGNLSLSGGMYYLGLLSLRSTAVGGTTTMGLSNVGLIGNAINALNLAGTISGPIPFGMAPADWAQKNTNISAWFGRQLGGFITNTARAGFGGSTMPNNISLAELQTAGNFGTVLPMVTFIST